MTGKNKGRELASDWIDPDDAPELTDEWFARATLMVGRDEIARRDRSSAEDASPKASDAAKKPS